MTEYGTKRVRNTGVRLTGDQFEKLIELSNQLQISRNEVIGRLIDIAIVVGEPIVTVEVQRKKRTYKKRNTEK